MTSDFKDGDLVWAKMKNFAPWPALIVTPRNQSTKTKSKKGWQWVLFFGSLNYGWVQTERIKPYLPYKAELSNASNTSLFQDALKQIEEHITKLKDDPEYEMELPPETTGKEKDDPDEKFNKLLSAKKQKKTTPAKRQSSDSSKNSITTSKRARVSSPRLSPSRYSPRLSTSLREENGIGELGSNVGNEILNKPSIIEQPESPTVDINNPSELLKTKNISASPLTFGFIGVGNIGAGVVNNLINSGHKVNLYSRTMKKCEEIKEQADLIQSGLVNTYITPCDVMQNSDIIFSCVTDPRASKEIVFGNCSIAGREGDSLDGKGYVEMTSVDLQTSKDNCKIIKSRGGRYLEAQVQGSKNEADEGSLILLTSGDRQLFDECQSCFKAMGRTSFYLGEVGYAIKTNLILQVMKGVALVGLAEGLSLADRCGIAPEDMLNIFRWTNLSCGYLTGKAEMIVKKNFKQVQQAIEHMQKDMKLALDLSDQFKQPLLMTSTANEVYKHARRLGYDGHDSSCIYMRTRH